jgi:hypothetical protein
MKGHIRERSPGHWAIVLESRDPETGKRRRRWHTFVGTKRQAQVECSRLIVEISAGTYVDPTRETVAAFLERWIEHIKGQVAPRSHERYAEIARKNVVPLLGGLTLSKLQPVHITRLTPKRSPAAAGTAREAYPHGRYITCIEYCARRCSRPSGGNCSHEIPAMP